MKDDEFDAEKVRRELRGNTLMVYIHLLKTGKSGVRLVQRALRFSSPALAQDHLQRLVNLGLAKSESGDYSLVKEVKVDVLREFVKLGSRLLSRFFLYAIMFTVLLANFVLQVSELNFYSLWALIFACLALGLLSYETISAWRSMP